jgi:hypothetical protein
MGLNGNDRLYADDGSADALIDCDGGTADRARRDLQDPMPIGCESIGP